MKNTIILYQSKYGATKKYAKWLSEALSCDLIETKKAEIEKIVQYDTIILGGGIYATGIAGISFLVKNYEQLKSKNVLVFAVGASPFDEKALKELRQKNLKNELSHLPLFYCRGIWNEDDMSWKDRTMCNMLKKMVSKKDPGLYESWEAALMQAIGSKADWTDKEYLKPIFRYLNDLSG